jgi:trehalose-phosphatase
VEYILSRRGRDRLAEFAGSRLLVAFDFDGALAASVPEPVHVALRAATRAQLRSLARLYPCVVISARSRTDARRRLAGLGIAEVIGDRGADPGHAASVRGRVGRWRGVLQSALGPHRGVWIEDRQFALAVHYRDARNPRNVRAVIRDAVSALRGARAIERTRCTYVIAPDAPPRAAALEQARARWGCDTALYVGEDETDGDVFALDQPGELLAVRVGQDRAARASFYLRNQAEIDRLLRVLVALRRAGPPRAVVWPARASAALPARPGGAEGRPVPPLGEVLDFMRLLWAIDHSLQRTSKRMARDLGLTGPQRLVIRIVGRFPGIAAGRLADLLYLHPSTLTGILARLESAHLVVRHNDPRDRRRALLGLTAAARALDVGLEGTVEDAVQRALTKVSPATLAATRTLLAVLADELQTTAGAARKPSARPRRGGRG